MKYIILLALISCSQINRESREGHESKHIGQHGFVKLNQTEIEISNLKQKLVPTDVKNGKKLYQRYCYHCHGIAADGNGPYVQNLKTKPVNLVQKAKRIPNFKFYVKISKWKGEMPGWKNHITEKKLEYIESYIRSLSLVQQTNN